MKNVAIGFLLIVAMGTCCLMWFCGGTGRADMHATNQRLGKAEVERDSPRKIERSEAVGLESARKKSNSGKKKYVPPARRKYDPTKPQLADISPALLRFALKAAMENDDRNTVFRLAEQAANTRDLQLREVALEALSWYGVDALPDMLQFMLDDDPGIASEAFAAVDQVLDDIEDEIMRAKLIETSLSFANDEDEARSMVAKLETVHPAIGITKITHLIESAPPDSLLREIYLDEYGFLTGAEYIDRKDALRKAERARR